MKIGIISDTHGDMKSIEKAIPYLEKCNLIIHAGDYIDDAEYIHYATDVEVKCVKGNCDSYNSDGNYELTFSVENRKFFLCHGHYHNVKIDVNSLYKFAKDNDIDVVVFGHTHVPTYKVIDNIIFINPGSLSYPREKSDKSFGILTIEDKIFYEEIKI
ncbi:metallophosphoesterase family protein [Terrisporobacter sp.]